MHGGPLSSSQQATPCVWPKQFADDLKKNHQLAVFCLFLFFLGCTPLTLLTLLTPSVCENALRVRQWPGMGSHRRPALMPFEMPQLISAAAAMNEGRSNRRPCQADELLSKQGEQYVYSEQLHETAE